MSKYEYLESKRFSIKLKLKNKYELIGFIFYFKLLNPSKII